MSTTFVLMPIIFLLGILAIAFEDRISVNKSVSALVMSVALWGILLIDVSIGHHSAAYSEYIAHHAELTSSSVSDSVKVFIADALNSHLGDVSGTLFFILSSMLLVSVVDKYGGFKAITSRLACMSKRTLLWRISFAAFFFSALFDNLAASIIIMAILQKLVPNRTDRLKYACMSIIACNAGGAWSPIGDVTTLLLWTNHCLTPLRQVMTVFPLALTNLLVPLTIAHFWLFKSGSQLREPSADQNDDYADLLPHHIRRNIFWIGMTSLALIPLWQMLIGMPAFMGALCGVIFVWGYTEIIFKEKKKLLANAQELRVNALLHNTDLATIFYFLGILMAVAALETGGQLAVASGAISSAIPSTNFLALLIGGLSSILDNVALVAAVMGMYPVSMGADPTLLPFVIDGTFWIFLAYCAVTGGSLLIIGSATGVTIMGMENIKFGYYLKRFSGLALLGYLSGAAVYFLGYTFFPG